MDSLLEKSKQYAITSISTGSLSFLCSSTIVCILMRSHDGLVKTYHRLLLGMCIGDMISSLVYMMSTWVMPSDVDYYVWNASGNVASCDAQGFLAMFGIMVTSGYNCSLCLFYLAVIKFKKKDEYIKKRLEPWMHAVPILSGLSLSIAGLVSEVYNAGLANCFVSTHNPPHCTGVDDGIVPDGYEIPCGRGAEKFGIFYIILLVKNLGILPGTILVSMTMMYLEVLKTEKKLNQYGINALRLRSQQSNLNVVESTRSDDRSRSQSRSLQGSAQSSFYRLSSMTKTLARSVFRSVSESIVKQPVLPRSNSTNKNTRLVLYRALSYAMAYIATYLFPIIFMIGFLVNRDREAFQFNIPLTLSFVFHPLQGLFNFMVFMYPRVIMAKRKRAVDGEELAWYQVFVKALVWRGEKKGRGHGRGHGASRGKGRDTRRKGTSLRSKNMKASRQSDFHLTPSRDKQQRQEQMKMCHGGKEEEKCEIEG